jgi:hypothetical protein
MVGPQALPWASKGMGGVGSQAPGRCCCMLVLPSRGAKSLGRQRKALWRSPECFEALGLGLELALHFLPGTRAMDSVGGAVGISESP